MIMDYYSSAADATVNYDFQDNVYLVSNIRPEAATQGREASEPQALYRIDTGADYGTNYTDSSGRTWRSDESIEIAENPDETCAASLDTLYAPVPMPDEKPNSNPIAGTELDQMYQSYRGYTAAKPRLVTYAIPMGSTGRNVDIVLHFAERFHNSIGQRVFDVRVEGATVRDNLDIFDVAGGKDSAYQIALTNRTISGSTLEIELDATGPGSADYPSIAGIEVLCRSLCSSAIDLRPPAIPVDFRATGSPSTITLNWDAGTDSDLKGYNVYRSNAPGGTFTKLNATLLSKTATQYVDTTAPNNATSYYQIEALDTPNNVSSRASSSALRGTQPLPTPSPSPSPTPSPSPSPTPSPSPSPTPSASPSASPIAGPSPTPTSESPRPQATLPHKALIPMVAR